MTDFLQSVGIVPSSYYPQVEFVSWVNDVVPQITPWPESRTAPDLLSQPATCAVYLASINANGGP